MFSTRAARRAAPRLALNNQCLLPFPEKLLEVFSYLGDCAVYEKALRTT